MRLPAPRRRRGAHNIDAQRGTGLTLILNDGTTC